MNASAYLVPHLAALALLLLPSFSNAQGTLQINFDGPPLQPPGSSYGVQSYYESGIYFEPLPGSDGFTRAWTGRSSAWPDDGTPYVIAGAGDTLAFSFENDSVFGVKSIDLAAFSASFPDFTVDFVGYHPDGSTITTSFSGNGINFQNYNFGSDWSSGLTRVEIPNYGWSLDNLVVAVPEPGAGALFGLGALALSFWWRKRK